MSVVFPESMCAEMPMFRKFCVAATAGAAFAVERRRRAAEQQHRRRCQRNHAHPGFGRRIPQRHLQQQRYQEGQGAAAEAGEQVAEDADGFPRPIKKSAARLTSSLVLSAGSWRASMAPGPASSSGMRRRGYIVVWTTSPALNEFFSNFYLAM